ncbi:MAG: hypothetical protein JNK45_10800, partial [Myxococcales bacterium]|nr:hypothetical protein [Myxococcales bacterium]
MTTALHHAVAAAIAAALPPDAGLDADAVAEGLARPPDAAKGDLAFPCFKLSKTLRKAPPQIAADLAGALGGVPLFTDVQAAGAYVNVRLDLGRAAAIVLPEIAAGSPGAAPARTERVMVEYSQPNTHKAFHV